jgi:hypothetical protein
LVVAAVTAVVIIFVVVVVVAVVAVEVVSKHGCCTSLTYLCRTSKLILGTAPCRRISADPTGLFVVLLLCRQRCAVATRLKIVVCLLVSHSEAAANPLWRALQQVVEHVVRRLTCLTGDHARLFEKKMRHACTTHASASIDDFQELSIARRVVVERSA